MNNEKAKAYVKSEMRRRSQIVSYILNNNPSLLLSDKDFIQNFKYLASEYKKAFIFIGNEKLKPSENGKYEFTNNTVALNYNFLSNAIPENEVLVKHFENLGTKKTHLVFLKVEPMEIYNEIFKRGYIIKDEYDFLIKEIDSLI